MLQDLHYLISKKLNNIGLKRKFDEKAICAFTREFITGHLPKVIVKEISYFNGSLMICVRSSVEINELNFFQEELKFFLNQKGYNKIKKIRIVS